ncbi:Apolipoprotein Eb [Takifugu flavidus]|uniref:Apolipoprotein Eb n=2 Tax=Takifugu flavidus TaxID=433684 RepID=A0A5C6MFR1_9TELE|nr:Apolipoprotein Eb [Takifugu flavidus]
MKVLVVLALAVFSGCQANLFYADAPKPQLEVLTDAFWDYVAKATQTADDTLQMVRKSQFGQDVSARLTESADMASKYAVSIQEQLPPGAQDLITKVTTEADVLRERVTQELSSVRNKLEPYTEDMKAKIQARVEQLKQELAPYADSVDSEALRATLMQKSEELKSSLEQSVKDLQAQLGPYTDDLKLKVDGHLQNFQQNLAPMAEKVQTELNQRAQQVKDMAAPFVDELRDKLDPYAQDLQARLASLLEPDKHPASRSFCPHSREAPSRLPGAFEAGSWEAPGRLLGGSHATLPNNNIPVPVNLPHANTRSSVHSSSVHLKTMNPAALLLALALVCGCSARSVPLAPAQPDHWQGVVNRFWQYITDLSQQSDDVVKTLKTHQISRELDTLITDTMAELTKYKDEVQSRVAPYTESSSGQLSQDMQLLFNKLQKDMTDAKVRSTDYLGELKALMEQNSDDVRDRMSTYTNKLKKRLNKDAEQIHNTIATYMGEIQLRTSQNLENMRGQFEPYLQQGGDTASKKMADLSTVLGSQAESLGQQLETQVEDLKTRLEVTAQELRTSLEGKMDELKDLLSPYATQIRENFESMVDKFKETATN